MKSVSVGRACLRAALSFVLLLTIFEQAQADDTLRRSKRNDLSQGLAGEDYSQDDREMLQQIFKTPLKRQWCPAGLAYNPVLGSCTLSLAAMRERGRDFRV